MRPGSKPGWPRSAASRSVQPAGEPSGSGRRRLAQAAPPAPRSRARCASMSAASASPSRRRVATSSASAAVDRRAQRLPQRLALQRAAGAGRHERGDGRQVDRLLDLQLLPQPLEHRVAPRAPAPRRRRRPRPSDSSRTCTVTAPRSTAAAHGAPDLGARSTRPSSVPRILRSRPRWLTDRISTRSRRSPASTEARPNPVMLMRLTTLRLIPVDRAAQALGERHRGAVAERGARGADVGPGVLDVAGALRLVHGLDACGPRMSPISATTLIEIDRLRRSRC